MYDQFYGFRKRPFSLNPDPSYLYQSKKHQTALSLMEYALINEAAFCVITGEPGIGKTTLVRQLLYQIDEEYQVGLLTSTHQSFSELLKLILIAFDIDCREKDQVDLYKVFYKFLIKQYSHHQGSVLIIDEAQNLAPKTLEELRMLSNINVDTHNVLQIILVGQESLRDRLKQRGLTQFAQRIAVDYHLEPLDRIETHAYILHRLKIAGGPNCQQIFGLETCDSVYEHTGGVPRLINLLCDLALVYGYAEQQRVLEPELISEVVNDKKKGGVLPLREHSEPLPAANLDALSQLHAIKEDELVVFDESPANNEEHVVTKLGVNEADRMTPGLDYLLSGRIFDETPTPANQEQGVQQRSFSHRSKIWFNALLQLIEKYKLDYPPVAKLLLNLPKDAYQAGRTCKHWLLEQVANLNEKAAKPNIPYLQIFKNYKRSISIAVFIFAATNLLFLFAALKSDGTSGKANAVTPREAITTESLVSQSQHTSQNGFPHVASVRRTDHDGRTDVSSLMPVENNNPSEANHNQSQHRREESIVVEQGQTLSDLLAEVYGRYDHKLLYAVLRLNPHIKSADLIMAGQEIKLPTVEPTN